MTIGNYFTLLIGDSMTAGLSRYSNNWNRYFKPLNAINCGIGGNRVQNILRRCQHLPSSPRLQNAVIMCGTNNIQHNSVEDIVDRIVEIKAQIYLSAVYFLVKIASQSIEFI